MTRLPRPTFLLAAALLSLAADKPVDFTRDVRPLLVRHCYACHGPDQQKGELRFDRRASALKGGDSGPIFVAGKPDESLLVRVVSDQEPGLLMPPKGTRLNASEIDLLRRWIAQGAKWPDTLGDGGWWSLRPVVRPPVPSGTGQHHPIDAFVRDTLREKGMSPSPQADRRTLIRRLSFDLIGLPPTPDEVDSFVSDARPDAYEQLVERLLASPAYGERWARHWLDVVHYGDTHGYDKDKPRPNAWPYRDYVVRAFNEDRLYSRFVREQLAGDILDPGTQDGIEALGFIAAGPWDFIGHAEVPETKTDGKIARHLDRDDMVATTMNTFVSLTVQCAQCHHHKFDPIKQDDYYSLHAVFAALDRADRRYYANPEDAARAAELEARRRELQRRQVVSGLEVPSEYGYHSGLASSADTVKWVQVDLGQSIPIEHVVLVGCHDTFNGIGAGFGFPVRYRVELSEDATFATDVIVLADHTQKDTANPGIKPVRLAASGKTGRYLRVTATRLMKRANDYNFALAEIQVINGEEENIAKGATVSAADTIEAPPRWRRSNLTDGKHPRGDAQSAELASIEAELAQLPARVVYSGMVHHGSGNFRGTGPDGGRPRPIYILKRGDVKQPLEEVGPGTITVPGLPSRFTLPSDAPEGTRRVALADWITNPVNPLTWRSIVNRVWRWHFGRGIVESPNDFGQMGQLPTHPALLDWLAAEFRDRGGSFKHLHRLIVTSATYRQVSISDPERERLDADNAYLWRMTRRRLEAEEVRDSLLAIAGQLDRRMGGPAFQDFVIEKPQHSPHYQYHLHDPADPRAHRRAIYRFLVRSQQQPFMTVLDCADPSMQVDKRNETLSPLQALALMNNGLALVMADRFARRVESAATTTPQRVGLAFRLATGREPTPDERAMLTAYADRHGLANTCRLVFNLNEFFFVD